MMKARLKLRKHAAVTHTLDALALMALGDLGADEGKRHGIEPPRKHGIHVVDQLTRN